MIKFVKCEVLMSHLRIESFDKNGKPIIVEKKDMFGNKYKETEEVTYRRGEIISLPEGRIEKLGKSVGMVMVPQVEEPEIYVPEIPKDGELKASDHEKTVAEIIPKDEKDGKETSK